MTDQNGPDLFVFITCMLGGAGLVGFGVMLYLAVGDIYDGFLGEYETFP